MKATSHRISIPTIVEVGTGRLERIGASVANAGFSKIVLFFGAGIVELFGEKVMRSFENTGITVIKQFEQEDTEIDCLMNLAFMVPANVQAVVGIGGGKILDIAKYVGFLNNLPFISVPTSVSNDGFSSSGCSLVVNGRRKSVPARMPFGIVVDLGIVQNSPEKLIFSGIGDLVSKITAVYDWEFEALNGISQINDFAVMIAKKSVNSIVRMENAKDIRDVFFIKELVDSLIMSGIAMEIAGNSAPASGSEHLISHSLDQLAEMPQFHGIQVGMATYLMSLVQEHRSARVAKFLEETGFFTFVKTLGMKAKDFEKAIEYAPTVKPDRYTYLHISENRKRACQLLQDDPILRSILVR